MSVSELAAGQLLDAAQVQVCESVDERLPQQFSSGMDQIALACEQAVQMPAKKKQRVAFDLSQNTQKTSQAEEKHEQTLSHIEKMQRALDAMKKQADLEKQLLNKAAKVKHMEKRREKEVHFSQGVDSPASLALHVLEDGKFCRLIEDVQLDRILESSVLWIAPEGTAYCKERVEVCKNVSIKLETADATHPGRLGFKKEGYAYVFRNSPRYQLCDGMSLNRCALLGDTWQLVITPSNPHKDRASFVNGFIDIWIRKNL